MTVIEVPFRAHYTVRDYVERVADRPLVDGFVALETKHATVRLYTLDGKAIRGDEFLVEGARGELTRVKVVP